MKRIVCLCLGIVAGCSQQPALICPPPATPAMAPPAEPSPAVAAIVRHFDAANRRAIAVVVQPDISSAQIEAIRSAEARARRALTHLGRLLPRMDVKVMAEARNAVKALEDALEKGD
jgi:hypothetical protein